MMKKEELINSLSKELVSDNEDLIENGKWEELLDKTTSQRDEETVIKLFIIDRYSSDKSKVKLNDNQLNPIFDVLVEICNQVGIDENNNPFLKFIDIFYKENPNTVISEGAFITLNNMYAQDVLDFADISGKGTSAKKHIIFNPNLYSLNDDDIEFMIKAFEWLSIGSNVIKMNLKAIASDNNVPNSYRNLKSITDITNKNAVSNVRNIILYDNPKNIRTSTLISADMVEKALQLATKTYSRNKVGTILKLVQELASDERELLKNTLKGKSPWLFS